MEANVEGSTKAGTVGGTLVILFLHLNSAEIYKTIALAAIGAVVSFGVSLFLKVLMKRMRKK